MHNVFDQKGEKRRKESMVAPTEKHGNGHGGREGNNSKTSGPRTRWNGVAHASESIFLGEGKSSHKHERGKCGSEENMTAATIRRGGAAVAANDYHLEDDGWEPDCEREERAFIERSGREGRLGERPSVDGQGSKGEPRGQGEVEGAHHKSAACYRRTTSGGAHTDFCPHSISAHDD